MSGSKPIIPYGKQEISDQDVQALVEAVRSEYLTQGPGVDSFEKAICKQVGAPHAIAVTNGTAALHLCAMALGVKPGVRVLVPAITFAASANCILYCGGDVEFVDIDPNTLCLDFGHLEKLLASHPRGYYSGVVSVDMTGYPVNLSQLRKIADAHGLWILEDACHAIGARYQDESGEWHHSGDGRHADASIYSFHPVKHITTGEGGVVTTANASLAAKIKKLRTHGITKNPAEYENANDGGWYHEMQDLGYNYRISDILCKLGESQLSRLDENLKRRREIASTYRRELEGLPLQLPQAPNSVEHAYHLFVIRTDRRKELYEHLKQAHIYTQVHYIPVYRHPYYQRRYGKMSLPQADRYYEQTLSLPMYHSMTDQEQRRVIDAIRSFYN